MKRIIPTILLCIVVGVVSAFGALWISYELGGPQTQAASTDFLAQKDPDVIDIRPITDEQAIEHWRREKPSRHLRIWEFLYRPPWSKTGPLDALTQMEKMKDNGSEVGGFKGMMKQAATVAWMMAIAGIAALGAAGFFLWRGKARMALTIAVAGGALLVGAAAFEAAPWLAPGIMIVAGIVVLIGVAVSTKRGQQLLARFGIGERQFGEVVQGGSKFLDNLSKADFVKGAAQNKGIIDRVSVMFIDSHKAKQNDDTQDEVKARLKGA